MSSTQALRLRRCCGVRVRLRARKSKPSVQAAALLGGIESPANEVTGYFIGDAIPREFEVSRNDCKKIIKIVGDASGKLAYRFEAERGRERLFAALSLAEIPQDAREKPFAFAISPLGEPHIERNQGAILASGFHLPDAASA